MQAIELASGEQESVSHATRSPFFGQTEGEHRYRALAQSSKYNRLKLALKGFEFSKMSSSPE